MIKKTGKTTKAVKDANIGLVFIPYCTSGDLETVKSDQPEKQITSAKPVSLKKEMARYNKVKNSLNNQTVDKKGKPKKNYIQMNCKKVKVPKDKNEKLVNLLKKTKEYLRKPVLNTLDRMLLLKSNELYIESSFYSNEVACLYLKVMPIEGPFILVPCLDKR